MGMALARVSRKLATIVAADVAGRSRLVVVDEEGTLQALCAQSKELIDPLLVEHGGCVTNTPGESTLIDFQSIVDAVRFEISTRADIDQRTAGLPEDRAP